MGKDRAMTTAHPHPSVPVRGEIKLGQFLKLAGLVEDGAQARIAVQCGDVRVNGRVEDRRGHRLSPGDVVEVELPSGTCGAVVSGQ
ncbi:ribosome-associated protein [Actinomyces howellii]|uniref:Ribosome-associated protein n=2 Tax=Actinomyces howellii TaxID=52771 RepID=A0A3S4T8Z3_9ACTO|nr:ribosome-associated protein [Actinomyces howellii]